MNDTLYHIGLSILSTVYDTGAAHTMGDGHRGGMEHQRLRIEARRILSLLEGRLLEEDEIDKEAQARPFFPSRAVDYNIAHSGVLTAVSYVKGKNLRTGCDVEWIRPRARAGKIAENFYSAPEKSYVFPQGAFDETRFYEIWALKKCFLRLRGLSVFNISACPSFISDEGAFAFGAAVPSALSFWLYHLSGPMGERSVLATALEGKEQKPPEIRWFSHLSLTDKKTAEIKAAP